MGNWETILGFFRRQASFNGTPPEVNNRDQERFQPLPLLVQFHPIQACRVAIETKVALKTRRFWSFRSRCSQEQKRTLN